MAQSRFIRHEFATLQLDPPAGQSGIILNCDDDSTVLVGPGISNSTANSIPIFDSNNGTNINVSAISASSLQTHNNGVLYPTIISDPNYRENGIGDSITVSTHNGNAYLYSAEFSNEANYSGNYLAADVNIFNSQLIGSTIYTITQVASLTNPISIHGSFNTIALYNGNISPGSSVSFNIIPGTNLTDTYSYPLDGSIGYVSVRVYSGNAIPYVTAKYNNDYTYTITIYNIHATNSLATNGMMLNFTVVCNENRFNF